MYSALFLSPRDGIVEITEVMLKVSASIFDGITKCALDELAARTSAIMATKHQNYSLLASRIVVYYLNKNTTKSVSETVESLRAYILPHTKQAALKID